MNRPVPITARPPDHRSTVPAAARPKATAMMTQPMVSSRIAEATMIWPRSRRMKFISRTTMAPIFTDAIDRAVPRQIDVTRRASGLGTNSVGSLSPSAKPQRNGTATPAADTVMAARPLLQQAPPATFGLKAAGWTGGARGGGGRLGACHAIEIGFVFNNLERGRSTLHGDGPPQALADTGHRTWAWFAAGGGPGWPRYDLERRPTMIFWPGTAVVEDPGAARRRLWDKALAASR